MNEGFYLVVIMCLHLIFLVFCTGVFMVVLALIVGGIVNVSMAFITFWNRHAFVDCFIIRGVKNHEFEIIEGTPSFMDCLKWRSWHKPIGLRNFVFYNFCAGCFSKNAPTIKKTIRVDIDGVPHDIDLAIDAKIVDVNKFVFANMVEDLCSEIEKKLGAAISEKFVNLRSSDVVIGQSIPILTEYNKDGVEYTVKVLRTRDMDVWREKKRRALAVAVEERDDFMLDAPLNNMRTIEKLREMNRKISSLEKAIAGGHDLAR